MEIAAARTFLEIVKTGSFVAAAANLNLTQTAVSARIKALESQLDRTLFIRNKAGARLTPAGEQFLRFATTLVQMWERARQQIAPAAGREKSVTIGGEHSLWNPLLRNWLTWMRRECTDVAVRVEIDVPGRLMEAVQDGVVDVALLYAPPRRPGIVAELLVEEQLVAATTDPAGAEPQEADYVYVDWGPDFAASHQAAFPAMPSPALSVNFGPLAMDYILSGGGAGYFRMAALRPHLEAGRLQLIEGRPRFSYSIYAVYPAKAEDELTQRIRRGLRVAAATFPAPRKTSWLAAATAPRASPSRQ